METIAIKLADFATTTRFEDLPSAVVEESKRTLLDSLACALSSTTMESGKMALAYARRIGGKPEATVLGFGDKLSCLGAAFANGELIQAMDYHALAVAPPGHISPYVIPAPLALAELRHSSGKDLLRANAVAHELSIRIGGALSYFQQIVDGETVYSKVYGHSASIFGGTAAAAMIRGLDAERTAYALGIAGHSAPVQSSGKWSRTLPLPTIKYTLTGGMAQTELTAVLLAELGHRGDVSVFEGEYGFWRFVGSTKWEPETVTEGLGGQWRFPSLIEYKHYPCGRIFHAGLDAFSSIIREHDLTAGEIERVEVYNEIFRGPGVLPALANRKITSQNEAQMSLPFSYALVAHGIKPGPEWQDGATIHDPKILAFMDKVVLPESYPDHFRKSVAPEDTFRRLTHVTVRAQGRVFDEERKWPQGSPAGGTQFTMDELVAKFRHNASRILPSHKIDRAVAMLLGLESAPDVAELMDELGV